MAPERAPRTALVSGVGNPEDVRGAAGPLRGSPGAPCASPPSLGPREGFQEMRAGWTSPRNRLGKLGTYTLN